MEIPYLIKYQITGSSDLGYLNISEVGKNIPFEVKRVFWTHSLPNGIIRGFHAHKNTKQILIAIKGKIKVTTEMPDGTISTFNLEESNVGVYLPPNVWHTMEYNDDAIQLVFCSELYSEIDYIRDYNDFKTYYK